MTSVVDVVVAFAVVAVVVGMRCLRTHPKNAAWHQMNT